LKLASIFVKDEIFDQWGISMNQNMAELKGSKLAEPQIVHENRNRGYKDFTDRKVQHCQPLRLRDSEWAFCYQERDANFVDRIISTFGKAASSLGMKFEGEPMYIQIPDNQTLKADGFNDNQLKNGGNYAICLKNDLQQNSKVQMVFILISRETDHPLIKRTMDEIGIPSQCMLYKNIQKKIDVMGVMTNLLRQINAKAGLDLYRIQPSLKVKNANTMVIGVDVVNMGSSCYVGLAATYNEHLMQYYSEVVNQDLHRDKVGKSLSKLEQDELVCSERLQILVQFFRKAFQNYVARNNGRQPQQIVVYRDGVGGPTFEKFVTENEGANGALQSAIKQFAPNYNPKILYVLLNKKVQTRVLEKYNGHVINSGKGTVVDTVIVE